MTTVNSLHMRDLRGLSYYFDQNNMKTFRCNCGYFSKPFIFVFFFVIALVVGLNNRTDMYKRLNALPEDRNELTTFKRSEVIFKPGNTFIVDLKFDAIIPETFENLKKNLKLLIHSDIGTITVKYENGILKNADKNSIHFEAVCPFIGDNIRVVLCLNNYPIVKEQTYKTFLSSIYPGHTNSNCSIVDAHHVCSLENVCIINGVLCTFFVYPIKLNSDFITFPNNIQYHAMDQNKPNIIYTTRKDTINIKENSVLVLSPKNVQYEWQLYQDFYPQAIGALKYWNSRHLVQVGDVSPSFPESTILKIINTTQISKKLACFDRLQISSTTYNENDFRSYIRSELSLKYHDKHPSKYIAFLEDPDVIIENKEEIINITKSRCQTCEIMNINVRDTNEQDIINTFKDATYVIGAHSKYFNNIMITQGVVIDIIPSKYACADWIGKMSIKYGVKTLLLEAYEESKAGCDKLEQCQEQCYKPLSNYSVKTSMITTALDTDFDVTLINSSSIHCTKGFIHAKSKTNEFGPNC